MIGNKQSFIPVWNLWSIAGVQYAIVHDERLGLWRWSVMVGRPEMLRMGDAESEHQAEVHIRAVIDRAFALEEMLRRRNGD